MDDCYSVIMIIPNIGEYHNNNVFLRNISKEEIEFFGNNFQLEYRNKHNSYIECIQDLKDKLGKIKKILEE